MGHRKEHFNLPLLSCFFILGFPERFRTHDCIHSIGIPREFPSAGPLKPRLRRFLRSSLQGRFPMKRNILIVLGLSLFLISAASAGGYGGPQSLPTWVKTDSPDIRSIIEQLPPGAGYILIHAADDKQNAGVNQYHIPWEQLEPEEICNDVILGWIPQDNELEIKDAHTLFCRGPFKIVIIDSNSGSPHRINENR